MSNLSSFPIVFQMKNNDKEFGPLLLDASFNDLEEFHLCKVIKGFQIDQFDNYIVSIGNKKSARITVKDCLC